MYVVTRALGSIGIKNRIDLYILLRFIKRLPLVLKLMRQSNSQIGQDVFVICELLNIGQSYQSGYFVEFGATDGKSLSNTYLLEKKFNWRGILVEPARIWHEDLGKNRNCHIDLRCVSSKTGDVISFLESNDPVYSTMAEFSDVGLHTEKRESGTSYEVTTVTLNDLLEKFDAPRIIDYLSIDTEGSEYEILKNVNFKAWRFKIITVEHNFSKNREDIFNLLTSNGYSRVLSKKTVMDDWYVFKF